MKRILVTGATGHIGSQVVHQLRHTGCRIRAMSRRRCVTLPGDVEVVIGDFSAPDTLDECLKGVDAVFLVWVAPVGFAAAALQRIAWHSERIVFLSSPHRTAHPFFQQPNAFRSVHVSVEELIERSGLQWTFLRPGAFALNCRHWWGPQIRMGNVVKWFHPTAATAPIHESDIAAVAVRALAEERHGGRDYVLTGPESLTQLEQLQIIGDAIGRPLRFEELTPETARRELLTAWPPSLADMLLGAYAAAVDRPALVTSTVADVTGAPARSFQQWVAEHLTEFLMHT